MTTKQLEQKVSELEKRITLLENQRPVINVYPYVIPDTQQYPNIKPPYISNPYYKAL